MRGGIKGLVLCGGGAAEAGGFFRGVGGGLEGEDGGGVGGGLVFSGENGGGEGWRRWRVVCGGGEVKRV